jgi:hypothetical protein
MVVSVVELASAARGTDGRAGSVATAPPEAVLTADPDFVGERRSPKGKGI